jgi:hypothetical protein
VHEFLRRGMDDEMWKLSKKTGESVNKEKILDKTRRPKGPNKKLPKRSERVSSSASDYESIIEKNLKKETKSKRRLSKESSSKSSE